MLVMSSTNLFRQQTLQLLRGFTVGTRVKLDPRYYSASVKLHYLYILVVIRKFLRLVMHH